MFVRVLGTIAVEDNTGVVQPVTSPRHRLVLAILAANRGKVVSTSRLLDLIWPEGPPSSAETSLQVTISQLRKLLEPDRAPRAKSRYLLTNGAGYCLDIGQHELDLDVLRNAIDRALDNPTESNQEAVAASWSPPILAEFEDASWARPIVELVENRRLAVIARRAVAAIERNEVDLVAATLQSELARRPFEERLAGLLMLALARQGRQAEALAVYETIRRRLRDELGLEPTVRLRSLERSILEHDPTLFRAAAPGGEPDDPVREEVELIGRELEVDRLRELVTEQQLVTVVGPAGAGKTTLAMAVARRDERRRTYFIDLTTVAGDERVARAVADAVGLLEEPGTPTPTALASALRLEPTLLVLDNCEDLLEGVGEVVRAVLDSPTVSVLATSRRLLGLAAERSFRLEPLAMPSPDAEAEDIFAAPACQLLIERSGLVVDAADAASIAEICRLLDGLPLALELGAYRLRSAGPVGLLRDLVVERDLDGPEDLSPGQRSLDAALGRSFDSLSAPSQQTLLALGVFAGSVPVGAVQRILADVHDDEVVARAVSDLVDRSLVATSIVERDGEATPVFGLLETVRSYARRVARRAGDADEWRDRHVATVVHAAASSRGPRPDPTLTIGDLAAEIGRALDHLEATASDGATHHQLVTNIGSYWYRAGRLREALARMQTAIDLYPDIDPFWRGVTLAAAGLMSFSSGEFRQLDVILAEAITVLRSVDMPGLELLEAAQLVARGDLEGVEERITTALASNSVAGMQRAIALDVAAYSGWFGGDYDVAIERFLQQERAAAAAGDVFLQGRAIRGRGLMLAYRGSPESGALLCQQSIDMIDDWENDRSAAQAMAIRSAIHLAVDRTGEARRDALGAMRRASTRFDGNPMMVAVPVMAAVEADAGRSENVARTTGWLRGVCAATGMYLPAESERIASEAEATASDVLHPDRWTALRSDGAAHGLAGLVEVLSLDR